MFYTIGVKLAQINNLSIHHSTANNQVIICYRPSAVEYSGCRNVQHQLILDSEQPIHQDCSGSSQYQVRVLPISLSESEMNVLPVYKFVQNIFISTILQVVNL